MPLLHLKTHRIEYKIEVNGKYTILRGDSGIGKTTLYELADLYSRDNTLVSCPGYAKIITMDNIKDISNPKEYRDYIILIDEDNAILHEKNTASILSSFDSWFIIINRSIKFDYLPIDLNNILKLTTSGKFHTTELFYPEVDRHKNLERFQLILCEDSRSGYLFMKDLFSIMPNVPEIVQFAKDTINDKTGGRSKIVKSLERYMKDGIYKICVVFDRVGISFVYDAMQTLCQKYPKLKIYSLDWSSYEGYLLASDIIGLPDIEKGLHIENVEEYLVNALKEVLPNITYSKDSLCKCFKRSRCEFCKEHGCKYKLYNYEDFIYGQVEQVYNAVLNLN